MARETKTPYPFSQFSQRLSRDYEMPALVCALALAEATFLGLLFYAPAFAIDLLRRVCGAYSRKCNALYCLGNGVESL